MSLEGATKPLAIQIEWAPPGPPHDELMAKIRLADQMGLHSVWVSEGWGPDAFTLLAEIALATERLSFGPGVVNIFSRSPALLAMTAAHLDSRSGGRFVLGLGTSAPAVIEQWHGIPWARPLTRLKEYAEVINLILRRERLEYSGELFKFEKGFKLRDFTPLRPHVPIVFGTIMPSAVRATGEVADGWMPVWWPLGRFAEGLELLRQGAQAQGRNPDDLLILPWINVFVADGTKTRADALREARLAWYITRMGPLIRRWLVESGFEHDIRVIEDAWADKDSARAAASVPERMVNELSVVGILEECVEGLERWRAQGAAIPVINLPGGSLERTERIFGALLGHSKARHAVSH